MESKAFLCHVVHLEGKNARTFEDSIKSIRLGVLFDRMVASCSNTPTDLIEFVQILSLKALFFFFFWFSAFLAVKSQCMKGAPFAFLF